MSIAVLTPYRSKVAARQMCVINSENGIVGKEYTHQAGS